MTCILSELSRCALVFYHRWQQIEINRNGVNRLYIQNFRKLSESGNFGESE
ncbi:hypothetical protein [Spirosoma jeollabukense]